MNEFFVSVWRFVRDWTNFYSLGFNLFVSGYFAGRLWSVHKQPSYVRTDS